MTSSISADYWDSSIAIIGMSGCFPGAAQLNQFWHNLTHGIESIRRFTPEELEAAGVPSDFIHQPHYIPAGANLENAAWFDAAFFGLTPKQAELTDVQHRIFLENAWQALENAGYGPRSTKVPVGVFAGTDMSTYFLQTIFPYFSTLSSTAGFPIMLANDKDFLSSLVSYKLNLTGPSLTVQTACSTSLAAVHLACQSLLAGECDLALAGGVSISVPLKSGYFYQEGMIFSADGHCRAFDAQASGTVSGNGCGVVVLKRCREALSDQDYIYAVVRGTAMNNDGGIKAGFTAPSVTGQARVIAECLSVSQVDPASITYIETHGTGTHLGDPIEIEALTQAFNVSQTNYCAIGSVKTNIGHLNSAAGIAGLIKTALSVYHRQIPPSLHFKHPNPRINFDRTPFYVNTCLTNWFPDTFPIRAGVSSFGIGGTNVHVILEQAPPLPERGSGWSNAQLLVLSACSASALHQAADNLREHLQSQLDGDWADAAYTLQQGRTHFSHRAFITVSDQKQTIINLADPKQLQCGIVPHSVPAPVFMFPGQGASYINMGRELYYNQPVFREYIDQGAAQLKSALGMDLRAVLYPSQPQRTAGPAQTALAQPALFVIEYALAKLWESYGVKPCAMIGHSIGEYTAGCLAGVFSWTDALTIIAARGRLMQCLSPGAMLSVFLPEAELAPFINPPLSFAAINSPSHCTVSGTKSAITDLQRRLTNKNVHCKLLHINHGFHSAMVSPIMTEFTELLQHIHLNPPVIPYISNITGTWIKPEEAVDPLYWSRHLRQPVMFSTGIQTLLRSGQSLFLEIGPGQALTGLTSIHFPAESTLLAVNSLPNPLSQDSDIHSILKAVGILWLAGTEIHWENLPAPAVKRRVPLPTYPFERKYYWYSPDNFGKSSGEAVHHANHHNNSIKADFIQAEAVHHANHHNNSIKADFIQADSILFGEQAILQLFKDLLGEEHIGLEDDFFELGGDSLLASQLIARIRFQYGVKLPLARFFQQPSPQAVVDWITTNSDFSVSLGSEADVPILHHKPDAEHYPVSHAQRRLWLLSRIGKGNAAYNMPFVLSLTGDLDVSLLNRCFTVLFRRHESLRTFFLMIDGQLRQLVNQTVSTPFMVQDLSHQAEARQRVFVLCRQDAVQPFNLEQAPLLRIKLFKIDTAEFILLVNMHHIISDGWSMNIMIRELRELYQAFKQGKDNPLPRLTIQYRDYAVWQNHLLNTRELKAYRKYWQEKLIREDGIPVLNLPLDFPRPVVKTFAGDCVSCRIEAAQTQKLRTLSRQHHVSLLVVLTSLVNILLHRYTGQTDIIVGAPTAGRIHPYLEHQIGFYLNTLVFRHEITADMTLAQLLSHSAEVITQAIDRQVYPFDQLVDDLAPRRDLSRSPIFDVFVILQNIRPADLSLPGLDIELLDLDFPISKFDITYEFVDQEHEILLNLKYSTDIFRRERIEGMAGHVLTLIDSLSLQEPHQPINCVSFLTDSEYQQVRYVFNQTLREYPAGITVIDLLKAQLARTPDHRAIISAECSVTYREFHAGADRLAYLIRQTAENPEQLTGKCIGILADRSPKTAMAIFAVLITGAVYLPLDPAYPRSRLEFMVQEANMFMLITENQFADIIQPSFPVIFLDTIDITNPNTISFPLSIITPEQAAYIIFTSGSTGYPKGVINTHRGLSNQLQWRQEYFGLDSHDRILHKTPLTFDNSLWEIFWPLCSGACVVIAEPQQQKDPVYLCRLIQHYQVTSVHFTPAMMRIMLDQPQWERCISLERIFFGGEPLPADILCQCLKSLSAKIYNLYGQSEAAMNVTCWSCNDYDGKSPVSIGRPLANTRIYITDANLNLQPKGIPGELHIAGHGLAVEYLQRPALTQEKFIADSFADFQDLSSLNSSRLFKTGDIGYWTEQGDIVLLGRNDHQLKIRGFRIEPGEIEHQLLSHKAVSGAVVMAVSTQAEPELCAWIRIGDQTGGNLDAKQLRVFLQTRLPEYMIPNRFVFLESFPLTNSGKLDRRQLPQPTNNLTQTRHDPPTPYDDIEAQLLIIWQDILSSPNITVTDNFFDLGGHSLRAARLASRILQVFGKELPLGEIFLHPTVRELAGIIRSTQTTGVSYSAFSPLACLQPQGQKTPLFFMHIARGDVFCYAELARAIGNDHPFYGLRAFGIDPGTYPLSGIENMAAAYIQAIQSVYPQGPYIIGGHSRGGVIAFEMAQQFTAQGASVPLLVFIDAFTPDFLERPADLWEYFMQFKHIMPTENIPALYCSLQGKDNLSQELEAVRADFLSLDRETQLEIIWEGAKRTGLFEDDISDDISQVDPDLQRRIVRVAVESGLSAAQYHNLRPYSGQIIIFRAADNMFSQHFALQLQTDPSLGWSRYAHNITIHDIHGANHTTIVQSPYIDHIAQILSPYLEQL